MNFFMDRRHLAPMELLNMSTQHALCADYLLKQMMLDELNHGDGLEVLTPVVSLMYHAFRLLLKAYSLHDHRPIKEHKNLIELVEMNNHLGFSNQEIILLKTLSKQYAFHKGLEYDLWDNQQQLHVFCEKILSLYERVQQLMPLELQQDYWN